jgi:hypothetical protein
MPNCGNHCQHNGVLLQAAGGHRARVHPDVPALGPAGTATLAGCRPE